MSLFVTKIMLIGRTLLSHLSGYDSNYLCSFALLHQRSTITTTKKSCFISFKRDLTGRKVVRGLWGQGFGWDRGGRGVCDSLGVRWLRRNRCFLWYVIYNDMLLGQFHLSGQPKRCELRPLGEGDRRQASLHWRVQRVQAHLWLRATRLVVWQAAFRQKKVTGSGEDFAEAWQVFGGTEWRLRGKHNQENCSCPSVEPLWQVN